MAVSRAMKCEKYQDLVEALRGAEYRATLITLEVGSRGMLSVKDLAAIGEALCLSKEELSILCSGHSSIHTWFIQSMGFKEPLL